MHDGRGQLAFPGVVDAHMHSGIYSLMTNHEYGVPAYDELIFVTHRDLVKDSRLPRFLSAVEQAAIFITNHPQESWQLFIKAYPNLDDALNKQAFFDTLPRFAKRPAALDRARYTRFGTFMQDMQLIKQAPAVEDIAVELQ